MIRSLVFVLFLGFTQSYPFEESLGKLGPKTDPDVSKAAVEGLIKRLIGDKSIQFGISVVPDLIEDGKDVFKVKKRKASFEKVDIVGSTGVAAAWGFHHYLKEHCNCHVSWDGDQLELPSPLPDVDYTIVANDRFRYYQNACTASYSFVWWNWTRWEREIDWMALNGFNLALASNGQEGIWRQVYTLLGLNNTEIDEHFSGPAFLSWNRMGNLRGWGGPLSPTWYKNDEFLQKQILARMRELGITPVLPAFNGHVPRGLQRMFPNVNFTSLPVWNKFPDQYCCPLLLGPQEPLFQQIGRLFLKFYKSTFGTDHIYNCDPFNEMNPPSGDLDYLMTIGRSIFSTIYAEDKDAVWMLQGWMFKSDIIFWLKDRAKALLTSVPKGKILVLDLQAELTPQYTRLDNFFGQPFIWCMLHNYGGTLGMHGSVEFVNENTFIARNAENSTMVGTGLTPEGINQNYVIYDLMMDMAWLKSPVNITQWVEKYAARRYGTDGAYLSKPWNLLMNSVYNYKGNTPQHGQYIFTQSPSLELSDKAKLWYNSTHVFEAWKQFLFKEVYFTEPYDHDVVDITRQSLQLLLDDVYIKILYFYNKEDLQNFKYNSTHVFEASNQFLFFDIKTDPYLHDVVDITRQSLQLLLDDVYIKILYYYNKEDLQNFKLCNEAFLELLDDLDKILSTNKDFMLGSWIDDARSYAITPEDQDLYEENARNQITLWGPNGEISDYATKQWSGIVSNYYKERWDLFLFYLTRDLEGQEKLNYTKIKSELLDDVEKPFTKSKNFCPSYPRESAYEVSIDLYNKWINGSRFCINK